MNNAALWYAELEKPFFAPPAWVFGPVWTVLYILIILSFGYVAYLAITRRIPRFLLVPFFLNLVFNLLYSPIAFGWQNLSLATLDIFLVLGTLVWAMKAIYPHVRWVAWINLPYLLWVAFATVLQVSILFLNV